MGIIALISPASAFSPNRDFSAHSGIVSQGSALSDLEALAEKSNPIIKFWDPLDFCSTTIFDNTQDQTIGFLRHAEINHGRVATAAFVGYIVQANGIHFPWPMTLDGMPFPSSAGSPPDQWDAIPFAAKLQII